jgi:type IV secretory pathway TrbL component
MPEHWVLSAAAAWLKDLALFCTVVKPALLTIAEFVLFFVGLATVVWLALRAH